MKKVSDIINENGTLMPNLVNGLCILKPEFLSHEDDFCKLLNNNGWRILRKKQGVLTDEQVRSLYACHKDKPFFNDLCDYMTSSPCLCCSCYKDCKDPIKDMNKLKEIVRSKWGKDEMKNAMHSCDNLDNVQNETNICFNEGVTTEGFEDLFGDPVSPQAPYNPLDDLMSLYAEEIFAFYQYFCISEFLKGKERPSIQKKFEEFAEDELNDHAKKLLKRINELSLNNPLQLHKITNLFNLQEIARSQFMQPNEEGSTDTALQQNIQAETEAINHYKEVINKVCYTDPVTCDLLKEILADEEEHLSELNDFYTDITYNSNIENLGNSNLEIGNNYPEY